MRNIRYLSVLIAVVLKTVCGYSQTHISGFVKDVVTNERLIGANVTDNRTFNGSITDHNGYFNILIDAPAKLRISYMGYTSSELCIDLPKDTLVEILLTPGKELSEIVIKANSLIKPNIVKMSIKELLAIPSLTGKPDVIKALQLHPGIKSQSEGSSLLLVRGGNPGENLYLFDNVHVIYVNHLGGFMSVFNPDIINSIDLYKGGFPARYGGKISSVVDIAQKEGSLSESTGSYNIGITDFSLSLEGPIKTKASYIFTGRKTLFDLLTILGTSQGEGNSFIMGYGFHDLNGKISWRPNLKNSIHFNIYQGDDYLNYWSKKDKQNPDNKNHQVTIWGNWLISLNWKHMVSKSLFSEQIISFTRYRLGEKQNFTYKAEDATYNYKSRYLSALQDFSFQSAWKYKPVKDWYLNFGFQASLIDHLPNYELYPLQTVIENKEWFKTFESALYLDNTIIYRNGFKMDAGLRLVKFFASGYNTTVLEPRLILYKDLTKNHQINLSYMKINQFTHLLYTAGNILANEIWIPSDQTIKPARSNQYTVGWTGIFADERFQVEMDLYYKSTQNLTTYKEGYISLKGVNNWHTKVVSGGKGEASGIEMLVRKSKGTWTGFISYGLSQATRQYPTINQGNKFLYDYDRPHSISFYVQHKFSEKLVLNATWIFQSGLPYTPVEGKQLTISLEAADEGNAVYYETFIYGERNSARMKDYHRLDLSLTLNKLGSNNKIRSSWTFSVYNAYNRKNPVYYYYNTSASSEIINPETSEADYKPCNMYQLSLFPLIPMVSYKRYFNLKSKSSDTFKEKFNKWLYHEN
ncbi:MAG: carboxypeptidase-like regulatory domain-containing protein [Lentimicrobiaceae bacterium]